MEISIAEAVQKPSFLKKDFRKSIFDFKTFNTDKIAVILFR
ncbi:hypothetical protein B739_0906 [Riemerella anatipestifer RA-CH-1]|uniref:Uncharacterized protein n=1 Tax=Riemerella anatipestifer RA-CH-1 TaxID=1228997 RepID=J9QT90_RIEAN|nr:hypothetical protein B739_0906 [Riemerella anatipestifer RA-CH-1]AIH02542.1 hypothetical protein M949_1374 [Riemerella anatipestifer CH3]